MLKRHAPVQMLHGEGLAHRPVGACFDPLPPQAVISVSPGRKVKRLPVWRPVRVVVSPRLRDRDPGAFGNRLWSIDGRDRDAPSIGLNPNRKTDPAIVGREPAVEQIVGGMLQQRGLPMRSHVENIDLIGIAAEHQQRLLVARPVRGAQAPFT